MNNNYHFNKNKYIEKEVELNSKGETDGDSEIKTLEINENNNMKNLLQSQEYSLDSNTKNNLDNNSQENTEELTSLELLNLNLMKSQSEDLSNKKMFNFHDVGIKLFPGAFLKNKKNNYEQNNINVNNNTIEENKKVSDFNFECNNFLCKSNSNIIKGEQKNGLALAFDYYSSFLEDKIK